MVLSTAAYVKRLTQTFIVFILSEVRNQSPLANCASAFKKNNKQVSKKYKNKFLFNDINISIF